MGPPGRGDPMAVGMGLVFCGITTGASGGGGHMLLGLALVPSIVARSASRRRRGQIGSRLRVGHCCWENAQTQKSQETMMSKLCAY